MKVFTLTITTDDDDWGPLEVAQEAQEAINEYGLDLEVFSCEAGGDIR